MAGFLVWLRFRGGGDLEVGQLASSLSELAKITAPSSMSPLGSELD
jgi:hypothetical protein